MWEFALPRDGGLTAVADSKGFATRHTTDELHGRSADCGGRTT
jgi:hypothetical protein